MGSFGKKFRILILPTFLVLVSFCGVYTLLNWWFIIKLGLKIKQDVVEAIIPIALPWLPILIFLRPRIKQLQLRSKKGDQVSGYMFVAWLGFVLPTVILQMYIGKASGTLTKLEDIHQLNELPISKYYQFNKLYVDRYNLTNYNTVKVEGKHNQNLKMSIYIVMPIRPDSTDTVSHHNVWYGVEYNKTISNRDSEEEKDAKWKEFFDASFKEFEERDLNKVIYFDNIAFSDDKENYLGAVNKNEQAAQGEHIILVPVNEPFAARLGNQLQWVFISAGIFMVVWIIMVAIPKLKTDDEIKRQRRRNKVEARGELMFFLPKEGFFFTPLIAYGSIAVWLIMMFSGMGVISFSGKNLLPWGANYGALTMNGEWWRLITSTFVHGGLMHIVSNLIGLFLVGVFLEPVLKSHRFVIAYIICGICSSLATIWWNAERVSVGASGAIFGMEGILLVLLLTKAYPKNLGKVILWGTVLYIGYNLVIGAVTPLVDNAGHVGGLVSGTILGLLFSPFIKIEQQRQIADKD